MTRGEYPRENRCWRSPATGFRAEVPAAVWRTFLAAAPDLATRFAPDFAILDIGLPVMDGYELALRLRQLPNSARVKLVALTGYGQESDRSRSASAGLHAHLVKPVSPDVVRRYIESDTGAEPG